MYTKIINWYLMFGPVSNSLDNASYAPELDPLDLFEHYIRTCENALGPAVRPTFSPRRCFLFSSAFSTLLHQRFLAAAADRNRM